MRHDLALEPACGIGVRCLALSSRNGYLSEAERSRAVLLSQQLRAMAEAVTSGNRNFAAIEAKASSHLRKHGWEPDYMVVRQRSNLQAPAGNAPLVVLGAAKLGTNRLIDNLEVQN